MKLSIRSSSHTTLALSRSLAVAALAWISLLVPPADAEEAVAEPLRLRSRTLEVPADREQALEAVTGIPATTRRHVIVQLTRIPNVEERAALAGAGVELVQYIAGRGWYASVEGGVGAAALSPVEAAWVIAPDDRLSPDLRAGAMPGHALAPEGGVLVKVLVFSDADPHALASQAEAIGAEVRAISAQTNLVFLRLPAEALPRLADLDAAQWIEPVAPRTAPEMDRARAYLHNQAVQDSPYGLNGAGVKVSIHEEKHAFEHNDLEGRWEQGDAALGEPLDSSGSDGIHASNTAGTIAGDGSLAVTGHLEGMAPAARILTYAFGSGAGAEANNYGDIADVLARNAAENIQVSNNSWGYFCNELPYGDYTTQARVYDQQVLGRDGNGNQVGNPMTVVFSGGNERDGSSNGLLDCISDTAPPYINYASINQPKPAKNIIVVGAVDAADDRMTTFSSWGPVSDGRLKPDIVAAGAYAGADPLDSNGDPTNLSRIVGGDEVDFDDGIDEPNCFGDPIGSANQQCFLTTHNSNTESFGYSWYSQTSAAAAMVSGNAAVFARDFFVSSRPLAYPLPSTIKAHFIHTARDLSDETSWYNPGPDYASGWGVLDMQAAIDQRRSGQFVEACLDQGETHAYVAFAPFIRATLVWDDAPGNPANPPTTPALVNDLDLVVRDITGARHYPWTLDPGNPSAPAVQTAEDHLNNVEVVDATFFPTDYFVIEVTGTSVPEGPQCYSLVSSRLLSAAGDEDEDAVPDVFDRCPGTPLDEAVDIEGCGLDSQTDTDQDGITDGSDVCQGTAAGDPVDANGCAANQGGFVFQLPDELRDTGDVFHFAGWEPSLGCGGGEGPRLPLDFDRDGTNETYVVISALTGRTFRLFTGPDFPVSARNYRLSIDPFCGVSPYATVSIRFVDMLAPGFDPGDPDTWEDRPIPAVRLDPSWTGVGTTFQVRAQHAGFSMTTNNLGPYFSGSGARIFSHENGVRSITITTDFPENDVDNLILMVQHPNTRWGDDVMVNLDDGRVSFPHVTIPGNTFIYLEDTGDPPPPADVDLCAPATAPPYFVMETSAEPGGGTTCIEYPPTCDETTLALLRHTVLCGISSCVSQWLDVTDSIDTDANLICGSGSGPFVVAGTSAVVDADGDGVTNQTDCDDGDPSVAPGFDEVCDGKDNDCDGLVDEDDVCVTPPEPGDLDGDGDVDTDDLQLIVEQRGQPAAACPECDLDGDGQITGLDARLLVLMCTNPGCTPP